VTVRARSGSILFLEIERDYFVLSIDVDGPDIKENREEQKKRKKSHDFAICKINSTVDFTTD